MALLLVVVCATPARAAQMLDGVVAVVNNGVILKSELDAEVQRIEAGLRAQGRPLPPADILRKQVLDHLVMVHLQLQEAHSHGVTVSKEQVDSAVQSIATRNSLSMAQFRQALAAQGMNYSDFRKRIHDEMVIDQLRRQEVQSQITVSDRDVDLFLENQKTRADRNQSYHLEHILIAVPDGADSATLDKARAKARSLVQQIRAGADFAQLAISNSDGQQALKGGDLGWFKSGALPTIFREVVPGMKPGQVSDPIRSPGGFHIVKVVGVRGDDTDVVKVSHAEHILLRPNPQRNPEQTRQLAETLYQQLIGGSSFQDLARRYSDDDGSAAKGGDLGWQPAGTYVPGFERQLAALQPGQISQPFQTRFGWHIVKLLGRRGEPITDKMRRAQARQTIGERRAQDYYEQWLRRLRDEAYVEYRLNDTQGDGQQLGGLGDGSSGSPLSFGSGS